MSSLDLSIFPEFLDVQKAQQKARQATAEVNLKILKASTVPLSKSAYLNSIEINSPGYPKVRYKLYECSWQFDGRTHLGNAEAFLDWLWKKSKKTGVQSQQ